MAQLVTLGETMAAFAPDRMGPLRYVSNYGIRIAGAESNTAIGGVTPENIPEFRKAGCPWRGPCQQPDAEGQGRRPRLGCLRGIRAHAAYKSQRRINRRNSKTAHPKR